LFNNPDGNQIVNEVKKEDIVNSPSSSDSPQKYSYGTLKQFEKDYGGLGKYGVEHYYLKTPAGYGIAEDNLFYKKNILQKLGFPGPKNGNILGVTVGKDIYLSKAAFASKAQLVETITHETGHVILNSSILAELANAPTRVENNYGGVLDNWGHVAIRKMSIELTKVNQWMNIEWVNSVMKSIQFMRYMNSSKPELDKLLKPLIKTFKF